MKATRRSAVLLGVTALGVLAFSASGFAEVQNVKVSGDVTVRSFFSTNLDLNDDFDPTVAGAALTNRHDAYIQQLTGINVGADLTENVSAFIRIASEQDWGGGTGGAGGAGIWDFDLSQAYITLNELFYSPLTVRIGQQPIQWGRGLILGSNLLPTVLSTGLGAGGDRHGSITANEYTDFTAFDAIRATLELDDIAGMPLTADIVYIKLDENAPQAGDDVNLVGANLSTRLDDAMNSEVEAYFLYKGDRAGATVGSTLRDKGNVATMGARGSFNPLENTTVYSELAYQFGRDAAPLDGSGTITTMISGIPHTAWLANLGLEYYFADVDMTPAVGFEWLFKSGRYKDGATYGWDPIAPSYFPTVIRSYQTRSSVGGLYAVTQPDVTSAFTNQHDLAVYGSARPMEDLEASTRLTWFILDESAVAHAGVANTKKDKFVGTEWDTKFVYDYTDDVTFGFGYGIFIPGDVFHEPNSGVDASAGVAAAPAGGQNVAQKMMGEVSLRF